MTNPQLRIRVAEAMGWKPQSGNESWPDTYWIAPDKVLRTVNELPKYDKDANLALLLVARLKEQGWYLATAEEPDMPIYAAFFRYPGTHRRISAEAQTLTVAICTAFLRVIEATQVETKL